VGKGEGNRRKRSKNVAEEDLRMGTVNAGTMNTRCREVIEMFTYGYTFFWNGCSFMPRQLELR